MARPRFTSLRGMHDVLPPDAARWKRLVDAFGTHFGRAGFAPIRTPILESLTVFARVGEGTDVVTKEMYDFLDRDGERIALRPESTAGVARAFVQHRPITPFKVWYASEHFRHERPQAGRYRQHHQLGVECFGVPDADLDVEVIVGLWDFYRSLGLESIRLELNTIGDAAARTRFGRRLATFLRGRVGDLDPEDAAKVDHHPLRVLDSKRRATVAALEGAPSLIDELDDTALAHFDAVRAGVRAAGVVGTVNPRLVRGLDYYTHTVFEIVSDAIDAAQATIGGGGRYDGLVEALGGPPTPAFGFGSGIERVLLACDGEAVWGEPASAVDAFVVSTGGEPEERRDLSLALRRAGLGADHAFGELSMKAQMKHADRSGARFAVIVGPDERDAGEVTVRDLRGDGAQRRVAADDLADHLAGERRGSRIAAGRPPAGGRSDTP
ncbi:MAG: histidine--tRNA ligase [Microthrixaceae bacterium]